jgi:phage shock protein PspC (stress-responsive transcriptional regulator)
MRTLRRSSTNKVIAGICGGFGEYFGIDPVVLRIVLGASILLAGAGLLFYLICWIVMPR